MTTPEITYIENFQSKIKQPKGCFIFVFFLIFKMITAVFYAEGPHFVLKALSHHAQGLGAFGNVIIVSAQRLEDHLALKRLCQAFKGMRAGWTPGLVIEKRAAGSTFFKIHWQQIRGDDIAVVGGE